MVTIAVMMIVTMFISVFMTIVLLYESCHYLSFRVRIAQLFNKPVKSSQLACSAASLFTSFWAPPGSYSIAIMPNKFIPFPRAHGTALSSRSPPLAF